MQQDSLRCRIPWVGRGTDGAYAKGLKSIVDHCGDRLPRILVAPIRLAQPVAECRFSWIPLQSHSTDKAIGISQSNGEAAGLAGCMLFSHRCNPLTTAHFTIWVRHGGDPPCDFPIADQSDQVRKVVLPIVSQTKAVSLDYDTAHRWGVPTLPITRIVGEPGNSWQAPP
jgi:hypothetical protein